MDKVFPQWLRRGEGWLVWLVGALAFAAIPVALGGIGVSWDGLNHHFYLGWLAEHPRFQEDFAAASYQAYQFPYLYWPAYRLGASNASGVTAGIALAVLQSLAVPPVWLVARACSPGPRWSDLAMRLMAVTLAFLGGVTLSMLDSTSNDMFAAIPLLWAIALAFVAAELPPEEGGKMVRWTALSALCAGLAVAFKLSNGPLVMILPLAWFMSPGSMVHRVQRVVVACVLTVLAAFLVYGYWGWQLWVHTGNPVYPFHDAWFEPLRAAAGWRR
jgi:hypothetical protein